MDVGWNNSKFLFLIVFASLIFVFNSSNAVCAESPDSSTESTTHEKIKWLEIDYSSTGTAVLQVVSPGMNLDPKAADNFDVDVWSDTDFAGIDLTVSETGDATGIFEGTVFFTTTDDTSGHRLRVSNGDAIHSKFDGNAWQESPDADKNNLTSTASIDGAGIPIENRVSLDKKSYAWNDPVTITINAPEENLDANSIETIYSSKDSIKIYTRHFGIDNYNLVETGTDSGIFSGKISLRGEFDNVDSDGITASFEYEEDKTAIGSAPIVLNPKSSDFADKQTCDDAESVDGICQPASGETTGDDTPVFGIFVYFDELFSWMMKNFENEQTETEDVFIENDYDEYGLKINFVERREMYWGNSTSGYGEYHTTAVDKSLYTIVSEIQNRDGVEKDFFYDVVFTASDGEYEKSSEKITILPFDSMQIDIGSTMASSGTYTVEVYVYENSGVRDQATSFTQIWILDENEN